MVVPATLSVPPERPEVHLRIDPYGRVRSVWLDRWGNVGRPGHGYVPFGGEVTEERRFGDVVIPSQVTIGWWFGTPRYAPLFEATLRDARPVD